MSTVVFLSFPTQGHIAPTLAVVTELIQRGERVIFYTTPELRQKIEHTGATFRAYQQQVGSVEQPKLADLSSHDFSPIPPTEGLLNNMARLVQLSEAMLPWLLNQLRTEQPDYVMLDTKSLWGNLACQVLDIPALTLSVVFAIKSGLIEAKD